MDLSQLYWALKLGKPKHKATIYDIRNNVGEYIKKPVFFLSTGRCGTQWFSELLNNDKSLAVFHKPVPSLAMQSTKVYELLKQDGDKEQGKYNQLIEEVFWSAREEYLRYTYKTGKRYIETNNYITFFAPFLKKIFPDAKFVHLVRHPGEFIRSGIGRNYYDGGVRDQMRIFPIDDKEKASWDGHSSYEKVAWLWNETNQFIEEFKKEMPENQHHFFNLNSLNIDSVIELLSFIELEISASKIRKSIPKKQNTQQSHKVGTYDEWDPKVREDIQQITQELCTTYGYTF